MLLEFLTPSLVNVLSLGWGLSPLKFYRYILYKKIIINSYISGIIIAFVFYFVINSYIFVFFKC